MKPLPPVSTILASVDEARSSGAAKGGRACLREGLVSFRRRLRCDTVAVGVERISVRYKWKRSILFHR